MNKFFSLKTKNYPKISIITPTLNSGRTINEYLESLRNQKYAGEVELIIADGDSTDSTLALAKKYGARIIQNKLKTAEAGKAIGAKVATGEILAFVDSDNILPSQDWLEKMITPFIDSKEIIASEPLYFTYRKEDLWLTRYFALLGMGDPLNLFIGNYDRFSFVSNKWTQLNINFVDKKEYLVLNLKRDFPTIGANGFLVKKDELMKYPIKDYLFDIDILKHLAKERAIYVAKVKVGIIHLFTGDINTFIRKQRRRIRDYLYHKSMGDRVEQVSSSRLNLGLLKFVIASLLVFPLIIQAFVGFSRKNDWVWIFHPLACWITLVVYIYEYIRSLFKVEQFSRKSWSQ